MKMTSNPWSDSVTSSDSSAIASKSFEDDFLPQSDENPPSDVEKLPDSDEYLSKLENKLKRLQTSSSVLQQLKDRREHCIEALLANDGPLEQRISDLELDQPVSGAGTGSGQLILRLINPEQPLTVGEVLHLVKHDELDREDEQEVQQERVEEDKSKPVESSSSESTATPPPSR